MFAKFAIFVAFLAVVQAYDNGLGRLPPMGWNTWCTHDLCGAIDKCTSALVRQAADAIVEQGMDKLGYEYVNMDDCWSAKTRNSTGHLQPNADRFPEGMKALADYVHSKGLKIGVYTCVGTETCRNGLPGSYNNFEKDADTLAGWGIDFVKADNCHKQGGLSERDLYSQFSHALNATGRPMIFSLCEWGNDRVWEWGAEVGHMYRVQMDHLPLWTFPPKAAGVGLGQGTKDVIEFIATLQPSKWTKPYGFFDPDFLETLFFPTMSFIDSRTEFSFWCLWSAPLIVATNLHDMSGSKKEILMNEEAIAIDQDELVIGGDRIANYTDGGQVWSKPLSNGDLAVIFYNPHDWTHLDVSVSWEQLGLTNSTSVSVRDIWQKKTVGVFENGYTAKKIRPHDVTFLRLSKK